MRAVNLLPSESKAGSRSAPQPAVLAAAISGVVAVAVIGGGNLIESARVASAQNTLNSAKIQLAATPLPPKQAKVTPPPPAVAQQMQPRLLAVSTALSTRIAWDRILREFSLVLPSDIQLSSLTLTQPAAASSNAAPNGLQLTGVTYSYDGVARLLSRMALVPDLRDVTLGTTNSANNVITFNVTAGIKGAAAPAPAPVPTGTTTTTGQAS
jgi:Tfp pilus assembly protein PilN